MGLGLCTLVSASLCITQVRACRFVNVLSAGKLWYVRAIVLSVGILC